MPPRSFHDHHVAIDDGTTVQKTPLDEVVDKIVLVQGFLMVAPSGMVEGRRSGRSRTADEMFFATNCIAQWVMPLERTITGETPDVDIADRRPCILQSGGNEDRMESAEVADNQQQSKAGTEERA